jgi:hypothetical protein
MNNLKKDGKAAIARWKGIRDQFRKKKPSGDSADESGGYVYGPLLNFLLPHVADRPSSSSSSPIVDYKATPKSADIDCNFLRLKFTELVKMMETTQELIKETQKEDDADLYGKTVANFLRKFGPRKQLQIRMEIDQLMMENLPED